MYRIEFAFEGITMSNKSMLVGIQSNALSVSNADLSDAAFGCICSVSVTDISTVALTDSEY